MRLVRTTYYIHRDCLGSARLPETHRDLILEGLLALQRSRPRFSFTVLECDTTKGQCIFSQYDFARPWPARGTALRYSAKTKTIRRLNREADPTILLHPEQILPEWHQYHQAAHTVDAVAQELGLYQQAREPARASGWAKQLRPHYFTPVRFWTPTERPNGDQTCQLKCRGCCLGFEGRRSTDRHRTAMLRRRPSRPIRQAVRDGLITPKTSVLDYGCGRGQDAAYLQSLGITVFAWDPVHRPHGERREADVVNLGYVLNVIEDPYERLHALQEAFRFARKVLIVSAQIRKNGDSEEGTKLGDGILTSRDTFQKYFGQRELRYYVESNLGKKSVARGIGLFYVFRNSAPAKLSRVLPQIPVAIVRSLRVGKVLPDAIYVHLSSVESLPESLQLLVNEATRVLPPTTRYNVVKIARLKPRISFLWYPDFDTDTHPVLRKSVIVDTERNAVVSTRTYHGDDGWILHGKELLVEETYSYYPMFKSVTDSEAVVGLLNRRDIGRKSQWNRLAIPSKSKNPGLDHRIDAKT